MGDSDWNVVNQRNAVLVFERLNPSQTHKSNADELAKLSLSVYVANFPSHLTVRELWNICGKVGTLVDVYIAKHKNQLGQMFTFCRYIKVANSKTLIDSLSNVWIGKSRLHANVAKFDRNVSTVRSHVGEKVGKYSQPNKTYTNGVKNMDAAKSSFASVLNAGRNPKFVMDPSQPIVLNDDCILERDLSCTLMGKIKDINALSNLYVILANEGFDNVNLTYLGGFWVLIDDGSSSSKEKLLKHVGVACWFTELLPANNFFVSDERLVWISTPDFSNDFSDNSSSDEEFIDEDAEHVSDTCDFEKEKEVDHVSESSCMNENGVELKKHGTSDELRPISKDPFRIYDLLNKNTAKRDSKGDDPTFPPGFTPNVIKDTQETKVEKIDLFSLRNLWGNFSYDIAFSPSVGYSGGLLCVWDPNLFSKDSVTISDSFMAIRGTWTSTSTKLLIVSVYAPQDLSERKTLWEYISHLIDQWDGESVILGDFNEVRSEEERFGTNFNASGANAFNQFISTAGLVDLPLEDHRPILMRDLVVDYGPTPFRVFHSWFIKDGFDKLVEDSWKNSNFVEANNISLLKKKFQALKVSIKTCCKVDKQRINASRHSIQHRISELDILMDKGMGDENSKYFHGIINKKRSQLAIRGVLVDGDWNEEPSKVKNEFLTHFSNLFSKHTGPSINLDPQMFRHLSTEQNVDLESNVTYEEIRKAVWDCGSKKSLRPDGFTFDFIRKYWKIIDQDVVNTVQEFFVSSKFPPECNSSFITLIPKKQDAKVDFEKAFDSVRWDYLDDILDKFGFGAKWRGWIQGCFNYAMGSILVNGSPTSEFKFHKGLKQGDPLSPFLFILVMESLHLLLNNILSAGLFKGIRINGSLTLSHLFYADDVVFIGKWDKANFITIVHVLKCFFLASGLKINIHKSKLMGIGISHEEVNTTANLIGCTTFTTPFIISVLRLGRLAPKVVLGTRRFFNGADNNERKISMIGWQKVLASKKKGGLRVSSFFALNRALLFKWIWRFISHGTSLWSRFIKAMYDDHGALDNPGDVSRSSPC
ncbi:RNA-directed DNA polymerase, eukaryota [Tanacetum coccineum]|uniref:RNA-directed DNA polymerase, eukaryota n=1 Tax=Tanacetum coccineum TaxID=301880 RepID=A0ABQ5HNG1_9ASTR